MAPRSVEASLVDKGFDRFLLIKVQLEERVTDLAQLLWVTAAVQVAPEFFQLKQPPSGERHNGVRMRRMPWNPNQQPSQLSVSIVYRKCRRC